MRALTAHALLHAAEAVVHDSTVSTLHVEEHVASAVGETGHADRSQTKGLRHRPAAARRDLGRQSLQNLLEAARHVCCWLCLHRGSESRVERK